MTITFLHTNDVYEISPKDGKGGLGPLKTLLDRERAANPNTITTFGGDLISPSLMSGVTKGAQMIDLYNDLGTDVAVKLNALQRQSALPLLVSADLETGAGFRFRGSYFLPNAIDLGGATAFPWQMALGAIGDTALAYDVGRVTAEESRALGIHVAYGPVLDVNNNPANPVIGSRSFSEDPALVARLGAAMVRGIQDHGMLATGKHFPGHGDTQTDSHHALPVVPHDEARLRAANKDNFLA